MSDEMKAKGPGRYEVTMTMPWGQEVPAELLVTTRRGWRRRPESRDGRWTAYAIGPAVVAVRLLGGLPNAPGPSAMLEASWPVPAEWN